jgi:hypothetical protein
LEFVGFGRLLVLISQDESGTGADNKLAMLECCFQIWNFFENGLLVSDEIEEFKFVHLTPVVKQFNCIHEIEYAEKDSLEQINYVFIQVTLLLLLQC